MFLTLKTRNLIYRANVKRHATRKSKEERKNGNKEHERTKSSTDGGETATEIEIAIETGTSVAGEWMTTRAVMIQAVIGRNRCCGSEL